MPLPLGRGTLGRIQIRSKHMDIHESSDVQWSKQHAELCDDAPDEHVWVSELTISCQEAKVPECPSIRPCESMHSPVENVMVLLSTMDF